MITALILILILSILVMVHEFGHFYTARKNGVRVEEFGWGIPPRIWGKKIGETIYSINLLPFGGFVKLTGEDDFDGNQTADPRSFASKTPLQRAIVLVAGVTMNVLLAIFVYYIMFFNTGFKTMTLPLFFDYSFKFGNTETINTVVINFAENSPAKDMGIEIGESVIEIDGNPVRSVPEVRAYLKDKAGKEVSLLVMDLRGIERNLRTVKVTPRADDKGEGIIGTAMTKGFRLSYDNKLTAAPLHAYNMFSYSTFTMGKLFQESFSRKDISVVSEGVSGPVGVFNTISAILDYGGKEAFIGLLDLTALLSVSLAFINIMPFPALDGGRLVFVLYEMVTKKKVDPKFELNAHKWGMIALLILIVLVTIKDVRNLL